MSLCVDTTFNDCCTSRKLFKERERERSWCASDLFNEWNLCELVLAARQFWDNQPADLTPFSINLCKSPHWHVTPATNAHRQKELRPAVAAEHRVWQLRENIPPTDLWISHFVEKTLLQFTCKWLSCVRCEIYKLQLLTCSMIVLFSWVFFSFRIKSLIFDHEVF